jgi:hypothetical protein
MTDKEALKRLRELLADEWQSANGPVELERYNRWSEALAHIEKRLAEPHPFNGTATGSGGQVFVTCSRDPMLDGVRICPSGYVAEFMKEEEK